MILWEKHRGDEFEHVRDIYRHVYEKYYIRLVLCYDEVEYLHNYVGFLITFYGERPLVKGLNLEGCKISKSDSYLITKIKRLSNLEILDLSTSDFTEFSYDFSKFHPKLSFINIWKTKITVLPEWLLNLDDLEEIDASATDVDVNSVISKRLRKKGIEVHPMEEYDYEL